MMDIRYPLSLRQVEDLLFERGTGICHETLRFWWNRFSDRRADGGSITGPRPHYQPFRRREGAMAKFRDVKTLQKFAAVHASIRNRFNQDRHLDRRDIFKRNRAAALTEWRELMA